MKNGKGIKRVTVARVTQQLHIVMDLGQVRVEVVAETDDRCRVPVDQR
jgi:hypothetical protein